VHSASFCIARRPVVDSLHVNDIGRMNVQCPFCNALHWNDERVSSSKHGHPEFGMCCAHGKVKLAPLQVPPRPLYNLFTAESLQAKEFRTNIVNTTLLWRSLL
jgi:hypothetical protein